MISMVATNSLTDAPVFASWAKVSPQMGNVAIIAYAPWLCSALTQVREIEAEGQDVPGLGDLRVAVQTAKNARILLTTINIERLPSPIVSPVSGGGLSVTWSLGQRRSSCHLRRGGDAFYFRVLGDEIVGESAVAATAPEPLAGELKWMLEPSL